MACPPFLRLPTEIRLQIFALVLCNGRRNGPALKKTQKQCICPTSAPRTKRDYLRRIWRLIAPKSDGKLRSWYPYHIPASRKAEMGFLMMSRVLYHEALDVLYRLTTIQLTSKQIVYLMDTCDVVDKLCNIIVSEHQTGVGIAHSSFYTRDYILRVLQGRRLKSLRIDIDNLIAQTRLRKPLSLSKLVKDFGLPTEELHCECLGSSSFKTTSCLSKLSLYYGTLISTWEASLALECRQLREMLDMYHIDCFRARSRNLWHLRRYQFPPLCQRIYLDYLFWLCDLRYGILQAQNHELRRA